MKPDQIAAECISAVGRRIMQRGSWQIKLKLTTILERYKRLCIST